MLVSYYTYRKKGSIKKSRRTTEKAKKWGRWGGISKIEQTYVADRNRIEEESKLRTKLEKNENPPAPVNATEIGQKRNKITQKKMKGNNVMKKALLIKKARKGAFWQVITQGVVQVGALRGQRGANGAH